jgi:hypothetical protein
MDYKTSELTELLNHNQDTWIPVADMEESLPADQNKKMRLERALSLNLPDLVFSYSLTNPTDGEMNVSGSGGTRTLKISQKSATPDMMVRPLIQDLKIGTYLLFLFGSTHIFLKMTTVFTSSNGFDSATVTVSSASDPLFASGDLVSLRIITV